MTNEYEHLNAIQKIGLSILKEIIAICKRHDLTYYVYGGTLLGAIRHQGFIPWDDDLDIGMFRQDYEKFLEIAPVSLREQYKIIDWKSDQSYPHPMGKVIKREPFIKRVREKIKGNREYGLMCFHMITYRI